MSHTHVHCVEARTWHVCAMIFSRSSTVAPATSSLSLSLSFAVAGATACVEPATPPLPDDALPLVEGLAPIEDEDPAIGAVRYTLTAQVADVKLVSSAAPAQAWTYNGTVPGPLLQARVGDDVTVVFKNELDEPTTIHWHGMRVPNEMDGVVEGEMKAVEPGETFTYNFIAPDAGTFWFHPHLRTNVQIERGLQGMFVVHEREDAPDVDHDRAFVLDDVYLIDNGAQIAPAGGGMEVMHGRFGNVLLTNGSDAVPSYKFAPGQVERWRIVNTANARTMILRFPGLAVRQIGADGGLWPQALIDDADDEVILPVGARAELEVRMADGEASGELQFIDYALDANDNVIEVPIEVVSVARDDDGEPSERVGHTKSPSLTLMDNGTPTHTLTLSGRNVAGSVEFTVNGFVWPEHEDWSVPQNDVQIIEVRNELMMEHPFHLHGQFFQVVDRAGTPLDDRGWRDTTLILGQGRIRVATKFDNPGMWMIHCHILEHEENGMMSMVTVDPAETPSGHDM